MFDALTPFVALGIIAGLPLCMLLFKKWDLPAYLKERFKLNTRVKGTLYVLAQGIVIAVLIAMVLDMLQLPGSIAMVIEGLGIGFNCAVLVGVLRQERSNHANANNKQTQSRRTQQKQGRRSKG